MKKYIPKDFEKKWQQKWEAEKIYQTDLSADQDPYYALVELPYSSGDLHMGHWFTFSYGDILSRFKRMQGYNVVFPLGFDAFGLPAENAAIKRGIAPAEWTYSNIKNMTEQFKTMGNMIDWRYSTIACDPKYYKWNQWTFLKMLEEGIAYQGTVLSSWCPIDQTVLADENIEAGKCWRCGSEVIKKEVPQWFLKITEYADQLLWPETPTVDYPKSLRDAQNKWIGKSEGVRVKFGEIEVFTTRIDTIFGATFLVLSPEHPLVDKLTTKEYQKDVETYIKTANKKTEQERKENKDKSGVFTGSLVENPFSKEKIPVWISDYVLMNYGTGAIMAVPAHDDRDFAFAEKFNIPIVPVIEPILGEKRDNEEFRKSIVAVVHNSKNDTYLSIKWQKDLGGNLFVGGGLEGSEEVAESAVREVTEETGYKNLKLIATTEKVHYHYHAFSKAKNRQIEAVGLLFELIDEEQDQVQLEPDEQGKFEVEWLPASQIERLVKDQLHSYVFNRLINGHFYTGEGILFNSGDYTGMTTSEAREKLSDYVEKHTIGNKETQYHLRDWSISRQRYWGTPIPIIYCDDCGTVPVPFEDLPVVLPEITDYSPKGQSPLAAATDWVTVNCPKCNGVAKRETDTMDGFMDNSWYFFRYLDPQNDQEIFNKDIINKWLPVKIYIGGAEHTYGHALYSRFFTKFYKDLSLVSFDEYALKRVHHGVLLGPDGHRMSKSRGNVINPDDQVKQFGADTMRLYLSFLGPIDIVTAWNPDGINGIYHFLQRVWAIFYRVKDENPSIEDQQFMAKKLKKVAVDLEELKNNTAIASLMEWLNYLSKKEVVTKVEYRNYLLALSPFAPHMTEELWEMLGESFSIHQQKWPHIDEKLVEEETAKIMVQVNGKVRDEVVVDKTIAEEELTKMVLERDRVKKFIGQNPIKKTIYIPGKILSFVI